MEMPWDGFIHESPLNDKNLQTTRCGIKHDSAVHHVIKNSHCDNLPINHLRKSNAQFPHYNSRLIITFLKKTRTRNLQFFLTIFWQTKIAKEMWRNVKSNTLKPVSRYIVFSYTQSDSQEQSVWRSDYACFSLRFRLDQGVIWCVSGHETGHIAWWNSVFCVTWK